MEVILKIIDQSSWLLREGNVSFYIDKWLKSGVLAEVLPINGCPKLLVKECRINNGWDIRIVRNLVGDSNLEEIIEGLGKYRSSADTLIWKPNVDGGFSLKSAWECCHIKGSRMVWNDWLWNSALPKKYSISC